MGLPLCEGNSLNLEPYALHTFQGNQYTEVITRKGVQYDWVFSRGSFIFWSLKGEKNKQQQQQLTSKNAVLHTLPCNKLFIIRLGVYESSSIINKNHMIIGARITLTCILWN